MEKILLVHGAWHTAKAWEGVEKLLQEKGYETATVTLAGNDAANRGIITYADIAGSLEEAIKKEDRVILVGHSSAGHIIQTAAPNVKNKIERIIFNNAWILPDGKCQFDLVDPDVAKGMTALAESRPDRKIPMDENFLRGNLANGTTKDIQDNLLKILVPQPLILMTHRIHAVPFIAADFDIALLHCKDDISVPPGGYLAMYRSLGQDKPVVEIEGVHECLFTHPTTFVNGLEKCLHL